MKYSCELYPTILTPFLEDGAIDYESLDALISLFAVNGTDGVFAVCQSSEMFFLSDGEKLALAEFCIRKCREKGMKCVVSGHTQDGVEAQIAYLRALEALKPDAIILVNNRFAREDEGEETLLSNFRRVLEALKIDTRMGVYECPYPYKRPLSEEMLNMMRADGRFDFVKDTCCQIDEIRRRLGLLSGSGIRLFNANSATLYESILSGAAGYSGVMLNMMPEVFACLKQSVEMERVNPARVRKITRFISAASVIEYQNYPTNAKHMLVSRGVFKTERVRNGKPLLTESQRKEAEDFLAEAFSAAARFAKRPWVSYAFEPGAYFPECHASSVLSDRNGEMVVYFAGTREKAADVGIWFSRHTSAGWTAPRRIAKVLPDVPHWNPVIYAIPGGVRVLFKVGKEISEWQSWHTESRDGGETWTEPRPCGAACGPVRSKPIRLSNGETLAPNSVETGDSWRPFVDISRDGGLTFERLAAIPVNGARPGEPNYMSGLGAIQPTLWESAPGHVHALLRTSCGEVFRSDSEDFGRTWREAYPTGIPSNNSGIDVVSARGALYLALNPVSGNWAERTPLVILKSKDNGKRFAPFATVSDRLFDDARDGAAELSYPALIADGTRLIVAFTCMRRTIGLAEMDISEES